MFVLSFFVGGVLDAVASTDAGTTSGAVVIASIAVVFSFLLSLASVRFL